MTVLATALGWIESVDGVLYVTRMSNLLKVAWNAPFIPLFVIFDLTFSHSSWLAKREAFDKTGPGEYVIVHLLRYHGIGR